MISHPFMRANETTDACLEEAFSFLLTIWNSPGNVLLPHEHYLMLDRVLQVRLVQGCPGDHQEIIGPILNKIAKTISYNFV